MPTPQGGCRSHDQRRLYDALLEDYKLKAAYATEQIGRMQTQFQVALTLESAVDGRSVYHRPMPSAKTYSEQAGRMPHLV